MRNIHALRVAIASSVAVLLLGFMVVPNALEANGADTITNFECVSSTNGLGTVLFTTDTDAVQTPSGNIKMTCRFEVPEAYIPSQPTKNYGYLCGTPYGSTDNSYTIVDTEGNAMMRCMIKANS
jgi:hypothetical protein